MNLIGLIETVQNTLELISIKGRDDLDRMLGCMRALDTAKIAISEMLKGGADNGRQSDNGTGAGDGDNGN